MTRLFTKKIRPAGLPPGSLYTGIEQAGKVVFSVIDYSEDNVIEKKNASLEECKAQIETPSMTWIQVFGVSNSKMIESIGKQFHLHSLVMEDIVSTGQRSKIDVYQDQIFIVIRLLQYEGSLLKDEQVSIVFGPNYLISFVEKESDVFKPIINRIHQGQNRIRKQGADYLAYALLDTIVDHYFVVLEKKDELLDSLEKELVRQPILQTTLQKIQHTKRDLIIIRKAIWPLRDVVNRFVHLDSPLINSHTIVYLQDVYDHIVHIIDIVESFRDVVGGMMDVFLSNINSRTNEIMKVLTIVSTIFVPLTFISSLYGMNFVHMPELQVPWAYPLVLIFMACLAISMLLFFRQKKWI